MVAMLPWPSVDCTSGSEAPRSIACEPCAWRSQCGDMASLMPALAGRALDHTVDGALGQVTAFAAGEDRIIGARVASQGQERPADDVRQKHLAYFAALSEKTQLHAIITGQHVRPGQGDHLGDAQASGIDRPRAGYDRAWTARRGSAGLTSTSEMMRLARFAPRWAASDLTLIVIPALKGV